MKLRHFIFAIFIATCSVSHASEITFAKSSDGVFPMIELSQGDYLASSLDHSNPALIRFDKRGNVISASEYLVRNRFRTVFDQLIETQDGGYLAAGSVNFKDPIVVKFNSTGIPQWQIVIPGKYRIYSIAQTQDGYLAVGSQNRTNSVASDAWIVKLNRAGRVVWSKILERDNNADRFQFVKQARDGGYILVGTITSFGNSGPKMIIAKLDAQGKLIWNNTYSFNEPFLVRITTATFTPTEGFVMVGHIGTSAVLIKVGSAGGIHWSKAFANRPHDLSLESVVSTRDGGYVAAGTSDVYRGPDNRGLLVKVDTFGKLLWSRRTSSQLSSIDQTQDNGFILSGMGAGFYGIMKTDVRGFIPNCRLLRRFPLSGRTLQIERHTDAELYLKAVSIQSQSITISPKKISVTGDDQCN